eukprot:COSAG01_NODE_43507_length_429_cov_0.778788_1_plen_39_part_10
MRLLLLDTATAQLQAYRTVQPYISIIGVGLSTHYALRIR